MQFQKHNSSKLEKGQVVRAISRYSRRIWGTYEIIGFTDDKSPYGKDPKQIFNSAKELYRHYGVRGLKDLEKLQNKNSYGFQSYIIVKNLNSGEQGSWIYSFEGKWAIGSGADFLSWELGISEGEFAQQQQEKEARQERARKLRMIESYKSQIVGLQEKIKKLEGEL